MDSSIYLELLFAISLSIGISFFCSISEAAFFSLPLSFVETLRNQKSRQGAKLSHIKDNMDDYIASILILNTLANTFGVILAGNAIQKLFHSDETILFLFPIAMTLLILLFAEMIPKTIGIQYAKKVAPPLSIPFYFITHSFKWIGLISLSRTVTKVFSRKEQEAISPSDIHSLASLGARDGTIDEQQESVIKNILTLANLSVRTIMTPRSVMYTLPSNMNLNESMRQPWFYSRVPITGKDAEDIVGHILRKDIFQASNGHQGEMLLESFKRDILFIPESLKCDQLLSKFLKTKQHIAMIVDEYGGIAGLVTLEDVLEEVLGQEIVDESDPTDDLQEKAKESSEALKLLKQQVITE